MTADFTIGNVEIETIDDEDGIAYSEYCLHIPTIELPEAPHFANDNLTRNSNYRSMSYGVSGKFFTEHGLDDFCNMFHGDQSVIKVTQEIVDMFTAARERHENKIGEKVPGWGSFHITIPLPDGGYRIATDEEIDAAIERENVDADLARLMWFEWWLKWALANCERPAIEWS